MNKLAAIVMLMAAATEAQLLPGYVAPVTEILNPELPAVATPVIPEYLAVATPVIPEYPAVATAVIPEYPTATTPLVPEYPVLTTPVIDVPVVTPALYLSTTPVPLNDIVILTTEVVTAIATYCPGPTIITHGESTYTVTSATTLTISDCPCTITTPVATTTPVVAPPYVNGTTPAASATAPAVSVDTPFLRSSEVASTALPSTTFAPIVPAITSAVATPTIAIGGADKVMGSLQAVVLVVVAVLVA